MVGKHSIYDFDLYIFDLDGTIIDSEYSHYLSYNSCLNIQITYTEYQRIFHSTLKDEFMKHTSIDKKVKEANFICNYKPAYIKGFEDFCNELMLRGKDICVVTNSSQQRVDHVKKLHPILNRIDTWYCNGEPLLPKPASDNYIKAITESKKSLDNIIIFEDSYIGYLAAEPLPVYKLYITSPDYYYYDTMICSKISDYTSIQTIQLSATDMPLCRQITSKVDRYIESLTHHRYLLECNINHLYTLLQSRINRSNIFFLGIGKCGHVCQKIVSTWSSLGIRVFYNSVEDLFHGEFAKISKNDIIIFISNSGNTDELIKTAQHCKEYYNVTKVCITFNEGCKLQEYMDVSLNFTRLYSEACHLNSSPTISSFLFMTLLDSVGTLLSENVIKLTKQQFKVFHPGGTLGYKKPIDTVVICACGKGTRLMPLTSHIPKFLVNIDNSTILTHIVSFWKEYTDLITIIIEEKYNEITAFYLDSLGVQYRILNVSIEGNKENAYTLSNALKDSYTSKKVLITWCDIFPGVSIPHAVFSGNKIFTNGNKSRYQCSDGSLRKEAGGNVVGIYYFEKFKPIVYKNDMQDICDVLPSLYPTFTDFPLDILHDVGDMDKLVEYREVCVSQYTSRYFNRITLLPSGYIKKESIHPSGLELIKREMKYYNAIQGLGLPFPRIIEKATNYMILEKMGGTLAKQNDPSIFLQSLLQSLQTIHQSVVREVSSRTVEEDLAIEFNIKIKDRLSKVQPLIQYFGKITHVNNIELTYSVNHIIEDLYSTIRNGLVNNNTQVYNLLHGDCNFSNIFIDSGKISFIDPRGYFGKTSMLGNKYYDYSKVLYALSGYDNFNDLENYYFTLDNGNIDLRLPYNDINKYKDIFIEHGLDWNICRSMCILHWLGLSQYISNNIYKSVGAYYIAVYMYMV